MDLLSDILSIMKLSGTLYFRTSFSSPWGVEVPQFENVSRFHYVHRGRCYAYLSNENQTVQLEQGDLIIITRGSAHVLSNPAEVEVKTLDQVIQDSGFNGQGALVYGQNDPGQETQLICGHFAFEPSAHHVLLNALPPHIHVKKYGEFSPSWLDDTLNMIGNEVAGSELGCDLVALRLAEVIFAQAIRSYVAGDGRDKPVIAGFADKHIRLALEAIHDDPSNSWTVESLAKVAGMSRTAFSNRFSELLDRTPLVYLTEWRMQLARHLLMETDASIIEVAARCGYTSEASFGRVFKRNFNSPPAYFRRSQSIHN